MFNQRTSPFCNLQVQEVPQNEFQGRGLFAGPILRVLCSSRATFLKPVTIKLPVSLRDKLVNIPQPSVCRVRIFYLSSDREATEWIEISDELENPANYDGKLVTFKVQRFSGYVDRRLQNWTEWISNICCSVCIFDNRRQFKPKSYILRWNLIIWVKEVFRRTVDSD